MGITNKKWFALGIVGLVVAAVGAACIMISLVTRMNINRMMNFNIQSMIMMIALSSETAELMNDIYLLQMIFVINRYNRTIAVFMIPFYLGICLCAVGGALAIIGWAKYFQLEK